MLKKIFLCRLRTSVAIYFLCCIAFSEALNIHHPDIRPFRHSGFLEETKGHVESMQNAHDDGKHSHNMLVQLELQRGDEGQNRDRQAVVDEELLTSQNQNLRFVVVKTH